MKRSNLRATIARSAAIALGGALVFVTPPSQAAEPAPPPEDGFTCRASVVRTEESSVDLLNQELFTANEEGGVCKTDPGVVDTQAVELPAELGTVDVLFARTDGGKHTADAGVANLDLDVAGVPITAEVLTSHASAGECPKPGLIGSSTIANITVNGVAVPVPAAPSATAVPGVGTVFLNHQTNEGGVLTQRALFVDVDQAALPLVPDVIVAEAVADIHGNPCKGPAVVDEGRCPAPSPEGQDGTPDEDCGFGQPSDVTKNPKGSRR